MLDLAKQPSQGRAVAQGGQNKENIRNHSSAGRKQDQEPEPGIKVWSMKLRQTVNSHKVACTDSCLMSPVIKKRHRMWYLLSVTSVTIDQWPELPPSSWAASSLYAFIFSTGFSGRICSPPCPSGFVLPTEFAVLCQTGSEIVYQRFTFWLTRLPGLSRTRAIFLLGLLGCCLSHLCSFASSLSDCLRMERLWFCWLCCFGSAVKRLLIIGAKE